MYTCICEQSKYFCKTLFQSWILSQKFVWYGWLNNQSLASLTLWIDISKQLSWQLVDISIFDLLDILYCTISGCHFCSSATWCQFSTNSSYTRGRLKNQSNYLKVARMSSGSWGGWYLLGDISLWFHLWGHPFHISYLINSQWKKY